MWVTRSELKCWTFLGACDQQRVIVGEVCISIYMVVVSDAAAVTNFWPRELACQDFMDDDAEAFLTGHEHASTYTQSVANMVVQVQTKCSSLP